MNMKQKLLSLALAVGLVGSANGQIAAFNFNSSSLADSANVSNIDVSDATTESNFNSFTSSSGWSSAAQVSGASSFFSAPTTQTAAQDAIFFTVTADPGFQFSITGFSFDARSTNTAPQDIGFTINSDTYDFSADYSNDSNITTIANTSLAGYSNLTSATISIQGWNSSGSGELQLDNLELDGSVVPEPSLYAALTGLLTLGWAVTKRRRFRS